MAAGAKRSSLVPNTATNDERTAADRPVGAEVQGAVERIAQPERGEVGHGDAHRQWPAQPAVKGGQQEEVDGEGEEVDDREPER